MNITVHFDSIDELVDFSNHFSTFPKTENKAVAQAPSLLLKDVIEPSQETIDESGVSPIKLKGKQHVSEANKMIEANMRDPEIYPILSENQKARVDRALGHNADHLEDSRTEDKDPTEIRQVIRTRIVNLQKTGDAAKLNAVRTALIEILDNQGTEYDKPKQSLIEDENLAEFGQKLTSIFDS